MRNAVDDDKAQETDVHSAHLNGNCFVVPKSAVTFTNALAHRWSAASLGRQWDARGAGNSAEDNKKQST